MTQSTQYRLDDAAATFDGQLGLVLRDIGLASASDSRHAALILGRYYVKRAAAGRSDRTATADDAAKAFVAAGLPANLLGNSAGALFKGPEWRFTGRWEHSERTTNHGHQNRVWELVWKPSGP